MGQFTGSPENKKMGQRKIFEKALVFFFLFMIHSAISQSLEDLFDSSSSDDSSIGDGSTIRVLRTLRRNQDNMKEDVEDNDQRIFRLQNELQRADNKIDDLENKMRTIVDTMIEMNRTMHSGQSVNGAGTKFQFGVYRTHPQCNNNYYIHKGETITFNKQNINNGNIFNLQSGIFRAPVSGIYSFTLASTTKYEKDGSTQLKVQVLRNGQEEINFTKKIPTDSYTRLDPSWQMRLNQNDRVQLRVESGTLYAYCANRIEFTGSLTENFENNSAFGSPNFGVDGIPFNFNN